MLNSVLYAIFNKIKTWALYSGACMLTLKTKGVYTQEQCKKVNDHVSKSRWSHRRSGKGVFHIGHNCCGQLHVVGPEGMDNT